MTSLPELESQKKISQLLLAHINDKKIDCKTLYKYHKEIICDVECRTSKENVTSLCHCNVIYKKKESMMLCSVSEVLALKWDMLSMDGFSEYISTFNQIKGLRDCILNEDENRRSQPFYFAVRPKQPDRSLIGIYKCIQEQYFHTEKTPQSSNYITDNQNEHTLPNTPFHEKDILFLTLIFFFIAVGLFISRVLLCFKYKKRISRNKSKPRAYF